MEQGGKKIEKPQRTKFRKNSDHENKNFDRKKHHDKTFYRLVKEERDQYVV